MNRFFDENVFLGNNTAKKLYKEVKDLPIFDYHCHLSPKEIAEDRKFYDLGELWLEGDHYKWRLMRANGADEEYVTGKADYKSKFFEFAKAAENAVGNAVYHWIHLELKKYFGINNPLNSDTAEEIWNKTNEMMKDGSFSAQKLILTSNVEAVFTTDDPTDTLEYHRVIKESSFPVRVSPSYRPDMAVCGITKPDFKAYIEKAEKVSNVKIDSIDRMEEFLAKRIKFFAENGCKVSDISLTTLPTTMGTKEEADKALKAALAGEKITEKMASDYTSYLLVFVAKEYKDNDIAQQFHMSALRNNNSNLFAKAGADSGNDSVAKIADIDSFCNFLDAFGKVDILINGAGGNNPKGTYDDEFYTDESEKESVKSFFELDQAGIQFVLNLNFMGTILPIQTFAPLMLNKNGVIINISSMNAYRPLTNIPAYSGAKAAISNLTQYLAVYFAKAGIRVNAIAPGFFVTHQNRGLLFNEDGTPTARTGKNP